MRRRRHRGRGVNRPVTHLDTERWRVLIAEAKACAETGARPLQGLKTYAAGCWRAQIPAQDKTDMKLFAVFRELAVAFAHARRPMRRDLAPALAILARLCGDIVDPPAPEPEAAAAEAPAQEDAPTPWWNQDRAS